MGKSDLSWLFKPGMPPDFCLTDQNKSKQLIKEKLFCSNKDERLNSALGRFKLELSPKDGTQIKCDIKDKHWVWGPVELHSEIKVLNAFRKTPVLVERFFSKSIAPWRAPPYQGPSAVMMVFNSFQSAGGGCWVIFWTPAEARVKPTPIWPRR